MKEQDKDLDQEQGDERLGGHLRQVRTQRRLTLGRVEKLSVQLGERINKSYLFRVERGKTVPSLQRLQVLAQVYRVKLKTLVEVLETAVEETEQTGQVAAEPRGDTIETLRMKGAEAFEARDFARAALAYRAAWERAIAEARTSEESDTIGQARHDLVTALRFARRWDLARVEAEAAIEQPGLSTQVLDKLRLDLAMIYWRLGRPILSTELFDRLLARSEQITPEILAVTHHDYGSMLLLIGRPKEAVLHYRTALAVQKQRKDAVGACKLYFNIGLAEVGAGNYRRAHKTLLKALEMAKKWKLGQLVAGTVETIGHLHYLEGDYARARVRLREANDLARLGNHNRVLFSAHYYLWCIARTEGEDAEARSYEAGLRFFASKLDEPLPELEEYRRARPSESLPDFPSTYQIFFSRRLEAANEPE